MISFHIKVKSFQLTGSFATGSLKVKSFWKLNKKNISFCTIMTRMLNGSRGLRAINDNINYNFFGSQQVKYKNKHTDVYFVYNLFVRFGGVVHPLDHTHIRFLLINTVL